MENKSHALIAGLFMIALSIALALAAMWFDRDTKERLPYVLVTKASVSGLTPQSAVRYRGLNVGKVESIGFDPAVPGQILVQIAVEKGTPITHSTFATLGYQGVTGLAYVQFDDDGKSPQLLETSAAQPARIVIRPGLFDKLAGNSEGLMAQMDEIASRLNTLLDPANQRQLMHTLSRLDATIASFSRIGPSLQPTLDRLPLLVSETRNTLASVNGMARDFSSTARDFSQLATRMQGQGGALERLDAASTGIATAAEAFAVDTMPRVNQMAEDGARSARSLHRAVDTLGDNPQSLLFGEAKIPPGPGEPGYTVQSGDR